MKGLACPEDSGLQSSTSFGFIRFLSGGGGSGGLASSRLPPSPTSQSISQASGAPTWGAEAGLPRHGFVMRV